MQFTPPTSSLLVKKMRCTSLRQEQYSKSDIGQTFLEYRNNTKKVKVKNGSLNRVVFRHSKSNKREQTGFSRRAEHISWSGQL